jgi:hypothetical protein
MTRTKQHGPCQVRSKTAHPCPYQAVVEIQGVPFCAQCAREQEAYFAIGKLTQEAQGLRNGPHCDEEAQRWQDELAPERAKKCRQARQEERNLASPAQ